MFAISSISVCSCLQLTVGLHIEQVLYQSSPLKLPGINTDLTFQMSGRNTVCKAAYGCA